MRSVVVLPQPEGPSSTTNLPSSSTSEESFTAVKSAKRFCRLLMRISAMSGPFRQLAADGEADDAGQQDGEAVTEDLLRPGLHQHHQAGADQRGGDMLPGRAAEKAADVHLRIAPKVTPRSRCLRSSTVNTSTGSTNSVVPAAMAGQSRPPSPMMVGMKGGEVCAVPLVSSSAKAYSFQAKIRQKIAVVAMPVAACGSTTLRKACQRV